MKVKKARRERKKEYDFTGFTTENIHISVFSCNVLDKKGQVNTNSGIAYMHSITLYCNTVLM